MISINSELLSRLSREARQSPRLRKNYNFHYGPEDPLQRMLNAMEPGTYIRPHKHENPDKREAFFALSGSLCILEFDDLGEIREYTILNAARGNFGVEIPARTWHSIISLETGSVAYEVKDGPYNPADDKDFAPWAPEEGSGEAADYLCMLTGKLRLSIS